MSACIVFPDPAQPGAIAERVDLPAAAAPQQRLVWPAEQATLLALQLPALPAARMRAALVGALEDRLLDDPASLHLALGPQLPGASARLVAACARQPLAQWLRQAAVRGQPIDAVVPEAALLQAGEALLSGQGQRLRLLWREDSGEVGWRLLDADADWPLPALLPQRLLHDEAAAAAARRCCPAGAELVAISRTQWLARAADTSWDLRQFELAPQAALQAGWQGLLRLGRTPQWRRVAGLLALLLLIQVLGLNARAWQLHQQRAGLQQQLQRLLSQALPGQPLLLEPTLQLRRALDSERRRTGLPTSDSAEALLGAAAELLPPGTAVHRLQYAAGQLELDVDPAAAASARQRCLSSAWRCAGEGGQLQLGAP